MGPIQTFGELLGMARRHALLIGAVVFIGAVASVFYALYQPHLYASTEVIQIERPKISNDVAPTTVEGSSARRLQLIEQQLMARDAILLLVEKFGLFRDMARLTEGEKAVLFRESVSIEGVAAARVGAVDDGTVAALTIRATFATPEKAQAVAHELAQKTIELSLLDRQAQTRATLDFFMREESVLVASIADLEGEIVRFRSDNDIANTGRIAIQQAEIGSVSEAILDVEKAQIAVQRELDLSQADVRRPATQRRIDVLESQIKVLDEQRAYLERRSATLRQAIQGTPEIESRIRLFELRLAQYRDQLTLISARRADAEMGFRLESNSQAERLIILEPAALPKYPVAPSRKKIAAMGTIASLAAALLLAFLLELRRPVLRTGAQMQRELGITPVVTIPLQVRAGRATWLRWLSGWGRRNSGTGQA